MAKKYTFRFLIGFLVAIVSPCVMLATLTESEKKMFDKDFKELMASVKIKFTKDFVDFATLGEGNLNQEMGFCEFDNPYELRKLPLSYLLRNHDYVTIRKILPYVDPFFSTSSHDSPFEGLIFQPNADELRSSFWNQFLDKYPKDSHPNNLRKKAPVFFSVIRRGRIDLLKAFVGYFSEDRQKELWQLTDLEGNTPLHEATCWYVREENRVKKNVGKRDILDDVSLPTRFEKLKNSLKNGFKDKNQKTVVKPKEQKLNPLISESITIINYIVGQARFLQTQPNKKGLIPKQMIKGCLHAHQVEL